MRETSGLHLEDWLTPWPCLRRQDDGCCHVPTFTRADCRPRILKGIVLVCLSPKILPATIVISGDDASARDLPFPSLDYARWGVSDQKDTGATLNRHTMPPGTDFCSCFTRLQILSSILLLHPQSLL